MSRAAIGFLVVVSPALALVLACLGLETAGQNMLGWALIVLGAGYPAGAIVLFWIRRTTFWRAADPGAPVVEEIGDRSFWLIIPGALAVFFMPPIEFLYQPAILPRTIVMEVAGAVVLLLGVSLASWARWALRSSYCGHLQIAVTLRLVTRGPYRRIRHPSYAGLMLMALGVSLGYSSLLGLAALPVLLLPGLAYRITVEERMLGSHFGSEFFNYARRTHRLFPGIW